MRMYLKLAAVLGFLSVALGAFGAHALKDHLDPYLLGVYSTAVQYQFLHALALLALGIWAETQPEMAPKLKPTALAFTLGILVFSGSLYALALTGIKIFGAITPIGGVSLLLGWALLVIRIR